MHAAAKRRAGDLGISFAEFARRLIERELATAMPQGDIDSICGMVEGTPFHMAHNGRQVVKEATTSLLEGRG